MGNADVTAKRPIKQYDGADWAELDDTVAAEYPLTIRLDGEEFATMLCTPADLDDLVVGFLAGEGVIRRADEIASLTIDEGRGFANVELKAKLATGVEFYSRRLIGSCCGKSRQFYFHNDARTAKTVSSSLRVSPGTCIALMRMLHDSSGDFRATGGLHNAALCEPDRLLAMRADIGRHNALDKLFGHSLRSGIPPHGKIIAFSGRLSSEVVLKTAKIGVAVLLSKSAPTDLALDLAHDLGITAVGFIRGGRMNVYTHPERVGE